MRTYLASITAILATSSLAMAGDVAADKGPTDQELSAAIAELRRDVSELRQEADGTQTWLTAERAEQVRQTVADVLADADERASLAADGATSGFKESLWIGSADGNFKMIIRGYMQVRFTFDHRSETTGVADATNNEWGWEVRRTKLYFEGHMLDPSWKYKTEFTITGGESAPLLEDAYIEKSLGDGLSVRAGQFKAPYLREFNTSDTVTQFADRSTLSSFFSPGRTLGAQLSWEGDAFRISGMFANAVQTKSNYYSSGNLLNLPWTSTKIAQYAFAARAEWLAAGTWGQFKEYTGWCGGQFGALVGLAGEVMKKSNSQGVPATYGDIEPFVAGVTTDLTLQFSGASLATWFAFRQVDPAQAGLAPANQYGVVVQGGYFLTDTVELIARYEYGSADTMPNGEAASVAVLPSNNGYSVYNAASVGLNWYLSKQRLRVTTDLSYAFTGVGAFATTSDFLRDGTSPSGQFDASGQVLVRVQLQMMF
ncbi:MAG: hypothetical protein EXS00_04105 [Phycisphaerales bacterium]|nr:hypothetical protein [Phycisphaerales bacterium]